MKILIAIDKFKGSLTSLQAAQAIMRGIETSTQGNSYEIVEIADGGDGSANVLLSVKNGVKVVPVEGVDPLGRKIESSYLAYYEPYDSVVESATGSGAASAAGAGVLKKCAFIEMAKISGLELIPQVDSDGRKLRNPLITTTYGLGQLIRKAYENGARKITLSIGGSATNDGGTGMLQALGFKFYRKTNSPETNSPEANSPEANSPEASPLIAGYMCGGLLSQISRIEAPSDGIFCRTRNIMANYAGDAVTDDAGDYVTEACEIEVICDVTNPLLGENGATYVYGPQKGADPVMLKQLEAGMENLVRVAGGAAVGAKKTDSQALGHALRHAPRHAFREYQAKNHLLPGAGAAGGVGYAVNHFLGGKIISGWRFFANLTNLKQKIAEADLVITGEGRIDSQSFNGKVIDGVTTLAKEAGKPVWLFCGINSYGQTTDFITAADSIVATDSTSKSGYPIFQLSSLEPDREKSMKNAAHLLERLAREAAASHLPIF